MYENVTDSVIGNKYLKPVPSHDFGNLPLTALYWLIKKTIENEMKN